MTASIPILDTALNTPQRTQLGLRYRSLALSSGVASYLDEGQGSPVVLLHGAPMTSLAFVRMVRSLREHHRVLAPDLPGFGGSNATDTFQPSLRGYARFVEEFCTALDLRGLFLFVNDASGSFGVHAAAQMRERVAGLVVADTVPFPLTGLAWPVKILLRYVVTSWPIVLLNRWFNLLPWVVATLAPLRRPFSKKERRALIGQFPTATQRDRVLALFRMMACDEGFMRQTAALAAERLEHTPTLLLFGQLDPMRFVGAIRRFGRMFPRHSTAIIPWEEHFPMLASGSQVAEVVHRWIAKTVPDA